MKSFKENSKASRLNLAVLIEHSPSRGEKCQNVYVETLAAVGRKSLHRIIWVMLY